MATVSVGSVPSSEAPWKLPARRTVSSEGSKVTRVDFATGIVNLTKLCGGCCDKETVSVLSA